MLRRYIDVTMLKEHSCQKFVLIIHPKPQLVPIP